MDMLDSMNEEQSLVGTIIRHPAWIDDVSWVLRPTDFSDHRLGDVFSLANSGEEVDENLAAQLLDDNGLMQVCLDSAVHSKAELAELVQAIHSAGVRRKAIDSLEVSIARDSTVDLLSTFDEVRRIIQIGSVGMDRIAQKASDVADEEIEFLWSPYLPLDDYTVLMADGGTGKTILCCGLAAAVTKGDALPGETRGRTPGNVLFISAEDSAGILKKRLQASGADLERCFILDRGDSIGMSLAEGFDEFCRTVTQHTPTLVILDPWHGFLGAGVDISRVNAVRPILQKLAGLAKKCHCAVIAVSHVNKRSQGENANNAATGSTDFINAARSALRVIFDDLNEDARIVVHTKSNYASYGKSIRYLIDDGGVVWDGFSEITKATLEEAARHRQTPSEAVKAKADANAADKVLLGVLNELANPWDAARFTYDEIRDKYGDFIFGGQQPGLAIKRVSDRLDGYTIKVGVDIRGKGHRGRGILICPAYPQSLLGAGGVDCVDCADS